MFGQGSGGKRRAVEGTSAEYGGNSGVEMMTDQSCKYKFLHLSHILVILNIFKLLAL